MPRTVLVWTGQRRGSGETDTSTHYLMYGFLTHYSTYSNSQPPLPNASADMKMKEKDICMSRELGKWRKVKLRIRHALVFADMGGIGSATKVTFKWIASVVAMKCDQPYSSVISWKH